MAYMGAVPARVDQTPSCLDGGGCIDSGSPIQAEGAVTSVDWRFVNQGQGRFEHAHYPDYQYVGGGQPNLNRQEAPDPKRPLIFGGAIVGMICVAALGLSALMDVVLPSKSAAAPMQLEQSASPVECTATTSDGLTHPQLNYCCEKFGTHCRAAAEKASEAKKAKQEKHTTAPAADSGAAAGTSFECGEDSVAGWSPERKAWCCRHSGRGCAPPPPSAAHIAPAPSSPKPAPAAAPAAPPAPAPAKQAPAPVHAPPPSASDRATPLYKCNEGDDTKTMAMWSPDKKAWCCRNVGKGCAAPAKTKDCASPKFTCEDTEQERMSSWQPEQRAWCCEHEGKGCVKFDCAAGLTNWAAGWSSMKKAFCCRSMGKGCSKAEPCEKQT